jgi:adenine deaminase
MASLNAAEYLRIDQDYGSLSPGRIAHINVVGDLEAFEISDVFVGSRMAVGAGTTEPATPVAAPSAALRTVHVARPLTASDMSIRVETVAERVNARVIDVTAGVLTTTERIDQFDVRAGELLLGEDSDTNFIAVIDRHHASGRIGHGLVSGFRLQRGAIASTNSPALMNLMALGANPADMAVAANRACQLDGGVVVAADGKVLAELALPLFGVLTDAPFEAAAQQLQDIEDTIASALGSTFDGLVTMSGFVMMPLSIPGLKVCDRGLVQVSRDRAVPVDLICER